MTTALVAGSVITVQAKIRPEANTVHHTVYWLLSV